jgi:diguanylate cyclase (GGDEF)-like protein
LKNTLITIALILSIVFLILLCVATVLFIIKTIKKYLYYSLYFKKGTQLYNLAFKDDLTDLFNRNAYIRDLQSLKTKMPKRLWFSIFDIDDFKKLNDTKGHLFGDKILIAAANRLTTVFDDKKHSVYRIGGDEFLVISRDISEDELVSLLLNIREIEKEKNDFRFSKGYSSVENRGPKFLDVAFENADKMLYADKKSKKLETRK